MGYDIKKKLCIRRSWKEWSRVALVLRATECLGCWSCESLCKPVFYIYLSLLIQKSPPEVVTCKNFHSLAHCLGERHPEKPSFQALDVVGRREWVDLILDKWRR